MFKGKFRAIFMALAMTLGLTGALGVAQAAPAAAYQPCSSAYANSPYYIGSFAGLYLWSGSGTCNYGASFTYWEACIQVNNGNGQGFVTRQCKTNAGDTLTAGDGYYCASYRTYIDTSWGFYYSAPSSFC